MSLAKKPMAPRPDPSVLGEPSPTSQCLARLLKSLEEARQWTGFATFNSPGTFETPHIVGERLGVVDPMLDTITDVVRGLAHEVRVSDVQTRNGIDSVGSPSQIHPSLLAPAEGPAS